jgi:hypothetical protein
MINIGLVIVGAKKGAFEKLDESAVKALKAAGLFVTDYPLVTGLHFVSKTDPRLTPTSKHTAVGKALGYLTPVDIRNDHPDAKYVSIVINFRRGASGRKLETSVLNQKVVGKTDKQIETYLSRFVNVIREMALPSDFEILDVRPVIE